MYSFDKSHVHTVAAARPAWQSRSISTSFASIARLTAAELNVSGTPARKTFVPARVNVQRSGSNGTLARPAADTIRPQFGSLPCIAHLTSGLFAIARAIARAASTDWQRRTVMATTF